jgi:hypothetical protein
MTLESRLDRLEQAMTPPVRKAVFVCKECPPDGATRVFWDDGTEGPPDATFDESTAQIIHGIDPDVVIGLKKPQPEADHHEP